MANLYQKASFSITTDGRLFIGVFLKTFSLQINRDVCLSYYVHL